MFSRFGAWSAVALLGAVVLVGCGKETKKELNPPTVTAVAVTYVVPTAGPATPTTAAGDGGAATVAPTTSAGGAELSIDLEDIKFSTTTLTASANTPTILHIKNTGATAHDFSIDELKISTGDVAPGASIDVTINAPAGTYTYYCNVPGHEAAGMKGTLTVTEGAPAPAETAASSPAASPASANSPVASAAPATSPAASLAAQVSPVASPSTASSPAASPASQASPAASPAAPGAGQPIKLDLEDIKFSTNTLEIPANTDVTIHITNTGAAPHDFSIDALKISTGIVAPGASIDVKINAPAGTYQYYCNVPGHKAAGMVGELTVK